MELQIVRKPSPPANLTDVRIAVATLAERTSHPIAMRPKVSDSGVSLASCACRRRRRRDPATPARPLLRSAAWLLPIPFPPRTRPLGTAPACRSPAPPAAAAAPARPATSGTTTTRSRPWPTISASRVSTSAGSTPSESTAAGRSTRPSAGATTTACSSKRDENGHGKCSVYHLRPTQCRTWPFWASNLRSERDWREAAAHCPGMKVPGEPGGNFVPAEQIRVTAASNPRGL